jgi:hypothetical protein
MARGRDGGRRPGQASPHHQTGRNGTKSFYRMEVLRGGLLVIPIDGGFTLFGYRPLNSGQWSSRGKLWR